VTQGPAGSPDEALAVRALVVALADPDPKVCVAAATALRQILSPLAAPALAAALSDRDPTVRSIAASALGGLGSAARAEAPALLAAIAAEPDPRQREGFLITLPGLAPNPDVAIPPLASRLARDDDERARAATARALGEILGARLKAGEVPGATAQAIAALRAAISDRSPLVRRHAVWSVGRVRASAPDPLAPALDGVLLLALSHRLADVRAAAATLYWRTWMVPADVMPVSDGIIRALVAALGDPEAEVRRRAGWALSQAARDRGPLGSKRRDAFVRLLPDLRDALRHRDPAVRDAAFRTLTALGHGAPEGDRDLRDAARFAATEFVALLRDPREDVRRGAATSLVAIDPRDADLALGPLRAAAADPETPPAVRDAATMSLRKLGAATKGK
jgi:HEAT repeat protein